MRSVNRSAASATARSEKLRRLSTTLRQLGDYQMRTAERLGGLDAGAVREFGRGNHGTSAWLATLGDGARRSTSPECTELQRVADLAGDALSVADDVSVRVVVRVRNRARVGTGQLAALRELCATAAATVGYLLGLIAPEGVAPIVPAGEADELMAALRELEGRGLIGIEADATGELRCRPATAVEVGHGD